jgi:threonine dehydratase
VVAGMATVGQEILEDLPDVDTVALPYSVVRLVLELRSALSALKPGVKLCAAEAETAAPSAASLASAGPLEAPYQPSLADSIRAAFPFPGTWPMVGKSLGGSVMVTLEDIASMAKSSASR